MIAQVRTGQATLAGVNPLAIRAEGRLNQLAAAGVSATVVRLRPLRLET